MRVVTNVVKYQIRLYICRDNKAVMPAEHLTITFAIRAYIEFSSTDLITGAFLIFFFLASPQLTLIRLDTILNFAS